MTQSKHTPGPWKVRENSTHVTVVGKNGEALFHDDKRIPLVLDDARLIAESPTMHDLLLKLQAVRSPRELHNLRCEVAEVLARIEGV